jgi:hypothetical protein
MGYGDTATFEGLEPMSELRSRRKYSCDVSIIEAWRPTPDRHACFAQLRFTRLSVNSLVAANFG